MVQPRHVFAPSSPHNSADQVQPFPSPFHLGELKKSSEASTCYRRDGQATRSYTVGFPACKHQVSPAGVESKE